MIEFRLLGPLEVRRCGGSPSLGGLKQQTLLAYLCLHQNSQVSIDGLTEAIWGERAPASARKNVQLYVSRLRQLIGREHPTPRLVTTGGGYMLAAEPGAVDLDRCHGLWRLGRQHLQEGADERAGELFNEAIGLWRGPSLTGLAQTVVMQAEAARLEQLRITLLADYFEARLNVGQHADVIPDLVRLVALHPHQEELRRHLMLALWRSGQRHEALATYRQGYHLMVNELGIEPNRRLRLLHRAVLADGAEPALRPLAT
ncbi:AfsR/SARP family transcriptional regulator [Streptomyces sp. DSM 44915]|uniref:AfsR/SARP family transcriptional regulator n=1 Tax=Streptomyces chisholmiae TaxID=3075540 RepID=A0ABU2JQT4_9ACTN|nr:AfsR/SARP family transcriptional regulator [Streptomyces sp. DSM 44915]MDT0266573.1 AfsR/SARP family transcriptional regulator [Streptomyces sp. DSM 44915]